MATMTKSEREDLQRLLRQREKAQKSAARLRTTELLADFETQMAANYSFDDDATWREATKVAKAAVAQAQEDITGTIPVPAVQDLALEQDYGAD